jgi:hypothetical protein
MYILNFGSKSFAGLWWWELQALAVMSLYIYMYIDEMALCLYIFFSGGLQFFIYLNKTLI